MLFMNAAYNLELFLKIYPKQGWLYILIRSRPKSIVKMFRLAARGKKKRNNDFKNTWKARHMDHITGMKCYDFIDIQFLHMSIYLFYSKCGHA